ncbi:MAG: hypothetical protein ACRBHB_21460 [Arenicella sp.]
MKAFKYDEPLVLKLINGDVISVKYLGKTDEGWMIVKPIRCEDGIPSDSELYIESGNIAWVARQALPVPEAMDTELFETISH